MVPKKKWKTGAKIHGELHRQSYGIMAMSQDVCSHPQATNSSAAKGLSQSVTQCPVQYLLNVSIQFKSN